MINNFQELAEKTRQLKQDIREVDKLLSRIKSILADCPESYDLWHYWVKQEEKQFKKLGLLGRATRDFPDINNEELDDLLMVRKASIKTTSLAPEISSELNKRKE